ncbi:DUF7524 family protein [Halorubrum vacuolatum]|uniref:Uncharacterized protein n=1 Tax=Halorubrum vacuolatum TaxID=63740 RepID=A0A238ULF7_HALVU|nr:hypothetical protein [Halorubrum vacuolatum]SNR22801.1 hypothetical protein SAMN06264855_1019 [Halorubrum vacuolatum]
MATLSVELNGDGVHSIQAPDRFTTSRPFSVELQNLGRSTHVHLHLDDDLDRVASLAAVNHFVEDEGIRRVHIATDEVEEPVRGKLKVVTGYGSGVAYVDVAIEPPPERGPEEVVVDETFAKPPERSPAEPPLSQRLAVAMDRLVENGGIPAAVVAFLAILVAILVAVTVESVLVLVAVGVVLGIALAALVFLLVW